MIWGSEDEKEDFVKGFVLNFVSLSWDFVGLARFGPI